MIKTESVSEQVSRVELSVERPERIASLYDETVGLHRFVKTHGGSARSTEVIERALRALGLSKNEAKVYIYLARSGERKASEISGVLSLHRTETYRILRDLEKRGLISSVFEKPLKFIAIPFEKALDVLIEAKKLKLNLLERKKERLIHVWLSLPKIEVDTERKEVFQILEGEEQVSLKADEIVSRAQREILMFMMEDDIVKFYHSGFLDRLKISSKKDVDIKFMAKCSQKARFFLDKIRLGNIKYLYLNEEVLPTFIIVDDEQTLLFIRRNDGKRRIAALWTNYEVFLRVLKVLFNELWQKEVRQLACCT